MSKPISGVSPAFVDEHDACLESVCLLPEGMADLDFARLYVFWPTEPLEEETEAYEVRAHRARLRLSDLITILGDGSWEAKLSVSDSYLLGEDEARIWWTELLTSRPIQSLELIFTTGGTLKLGVGEAHLTLLDAGEYLERWSGPLGGEPVS